MPINELQKRHDVGNWYIRQNRLSIRALVCLDIKDITFFREKRPKDAAA